MACDECGMKCQGSCSKPDCTTCKSQTECPTCGEYVRQEQDCQKCSSVAEREPVLPRRIFCKECGDRGCSWNCQSDPSLPSFWQEAEESEGSACKPDKSLRCQSCGGCNSGCYLCLPYPSYLSETEESEADDPEEHVCANCDMTHSILDLCDHDDCHACQLRDPAHACQSDHVACRWCDLPYLVCGGPCDCQEELQTTAVDLVDKCTSCGKKYSGCKCYDFPDCANCGLKHSILQLCDPGSCQACQLRDPAHKRQSDDVPCKWCDWSGDFSQQSHPSTPTTTPPAANSPDLEALVTMMDSIIMMGKDHLDNDQLPLFWNHEEKCLHDCACTKTLDPSEMARLNGIARKHWAELDEISFCVHCLDKCRLVARRADTEVKAMLTKTAALTCRDQSAEHYCGVQVTEMSIATICEHHFTKTINACDALALAIGVLPGTTICGQCLDEQQVIMCNYTVAGLDHRCNHSTPPTWIAYSAAGVANIILPDDTLLCSDCLGQGLLTIKPVHGIFANRQGPGGLGDPQCVCLAHEQVCPCVGAATHERQEINLEWLLLQNMQQDATRTKINQMRIDAQTAKVDWLTKSYNLFIVSIGGYIDIA